MGDLADIILEMLNDFEETHGRTPNMDEIHVIRCDSVIIAEAHAVDELEDTMYSPNRARVDWLEA